MNTYSDTMQPIKQDMNVIEVPDEPPTIALDDVYVHEYVQLKEINIDILKLRRNLKVCYLEL